LVQEYLHLFDEYYAVHHKKKGRKKLSSNSVKVLMICEQINEELRQEQKILVLLQLIEFVSFDETRDEKAIDFLETVADIFNISKEEFLNAKAFLFNELEKIVEPGRFLVINNKKECLKEKYKHIYSEKLNGEVIILHLPSTNTFVLKYNGNDQLSMNGHHIKQNWGYIFDKGASIRSAKVAPVYYSDVLNTFLQSHVKQKVIFEARNVDFKFKNSENGIQSFNFKAKGGELIGVMGGSGAGKSTLLNVFNGTLQPQKGEILINGYNIYLEKDKIEGVIGFIPQDDLLIEELTVYQNLYYSAKLCFRNYSEEKITRECYRVLHELDLYEIRDLKVGGPLNKFISGGQRKRLNIALELIREPSVMFVDEPTSGLSSMDSEMVMDLLKEQALKGKLVIVNIHQPSSDIYKMFDKLLMMDRGGHPIYYGNPVDAIVYFKKLSNYANANESECPVCGNVNPEQVLQIVEAKVVDEYGKLTRKRKVSPREWYTYYKEQLDPKIDDNTKTSKTELPKNNFKIPGKIKQFFIYFMRDISSKITNKQYILLTFLEAPVLGVILGYFTKYIARDVYVFSENQNFPGFLFMSVVVSLFLGMTLSAEEIIKDRKILQRESFLNLSRFSYVNAKVIIMLIISAIQTFTFVILANSILEIQGMTISFWLILFTTSAFANILGLNISSSLNSVVTIYILIPFILVPQLLLSGTVIKFDKLHKSISSAKYVPFVGDLMTSRWAYEALAVVQFINNKYERNFYIIDKLKSDYGYIYSALIPELESRINIVLNDITKPELKEKVEKNITIIHNETAKLEKRSGVKCKIINKITTTGFNNEIAAKLEKYLSKLKREYTKKRAKISKKGDEIYKQLVKQYGNEEIVTKLKEDNYNIALAEIVTNKQELERIKEADNELIQMVDPVFKYPTNKYGRAHFYAPVKRLGNLIIPTPDFNVMFIWLTSLFLYITLVFDGFRKLFKLSGNLKRLLHKK
jgi:ABC-type multidrug transport system ATPase subunit